MTRSGAGRYGYFYSKPEFSQLAEKAHRPGWSSACPHLADFVRVEGQDKLF